MWGLFGNQPEGNGDNNECGGESQRPNDATKQLSQEEMKAKRLAKMTSSSNESTPVGFSSPDRSVSSSSEAMNMSPVAVAPSTTPASPHPKDNFGVKRTVMDASLQSPFRSKDIPMSPKSATMTEEMKADRYAKQLSNTLEQVLCMYLPTAADSIKTDNTIEPLLCDEDTANYYNGRISLSNLSELLCIKLASTPLSLTIKHNAILYLFNCYKRISVRTTTVPSEQLKKDLLE